MKTVVVTININWNLIFKIFLSFLKISPISFGGGYAIIPIIEREVVSNRKWVRTQDIADVFAIAQSAPGAIALNSAIFIGYKIAGVTGAIAALIGVLIPTFSIVIILSVTFLFIQHNPVVEAAFQGISAAVVALIAYAGYKIGQTAVIDKTTFITAGLTVVVLLFLDIHPVMIILLGIIAGIVQVKVKEKMGLVVILDEEESINHASNVSKTENSGS